MSLNIEILAYLCARNADLEVVWVLGSILLVYSSSILLEDFTDSSEIGGRVHHQLARITFSDLDVLLVHFGISEDEFKCCNGHGLRNSDEVENTLIFNAGHVE